MQSDRNVRDQIAPGVARALDTGGEVHSQLGVGARTGDELTIAESQERFRFLFDHSRDIILMMERNGRILDANEAAVRAYGYSREELLSMNILDLRASETRLAAIEQMALADLHGIEFETLHRRKDGSTFPVEVSSRGESHGSQRLLLSIIRDITQRQQYRLLFEQMGEAFALHEMIIDESGLPQDYRFVDVNPAFERMIGMRRTEVVGRRVLEILPDLDRVWMETFEEVVRTGKTLTLEDYATPLRRYYQVTAFRPREGQLATLFFDITERENASRATSHHAAELEAIFENTQAQLALLDRDMNFVLVNSAYAAGCGHSQEELIGRNHFELFPNAENQEIFERVRDMGMAHEAVEKPFEYADQPERGTTYWNWVLAPIKDQSGRVTELLLSLIDVTAQVRARQQMRRLRDEAECRAAELDAVIASIPDAVVVYSPDGTITRTNSAAQTLLGYSASDMLKSIEVRTASLRVEGPDGKPFPLEQAPPAMALRGETVDGVEMLFHTPTGRAVWTSASAAPIRGADDQMLGAVVVLRDITLSKRAEAERERLLAREREARSVAEAAAQARDEFMSIAAHELKTPITSLRGYAELLVRQFEKTGTVDPARLAKAMGQIAQQSMRLSLLTEQLLNVSRMDAGRLALSRTETDVMSLVKRATESVRKLSPHRRFVFRGRTSLSACLDGLRLEQVVMNLLDNAVKYSPADSPIEIELEEDSGGEIQLSVRDHGDGVPEADRDRIFERFHQSHGARNNGGLGLGLFISRQIVEMHGGTISYEPAEGGGSRFTVRLPVSHCADQPRQGGAP